MTMLRDFKNKVKDELILREDKFVNIEDLGDLLETIDNLYDEILVIRDVYEGGDKHDQNIN